MLEVRYFVRNYRKIFLLEAEGKFCSREGVKIKGFWVIERSDCKG